MTDIRAVYGLGLKKRWGSLEWIMLLLWGRHFQTVDTPGWWLTAVRRFWSRHQPRPVRPALDKDRTSSRTATVWMSTPDNSTRHTTSHYTSLLANLYNFHTTPPRDIVIVSGFRTWLDLIFLKITSTISLLLVGVLTDYRILYSRDLNLFEFEKSSTFNLTTARGHWQRHTILGKCLFMDFKVKWEKILASKS